MNSKQNYHKDPLAVKLRALDDCENIPLSEQTVFATHILLQKARQAKNITQSELANKLSIHKNILKDYESGYVLPSKIIIRQIEKILSVKIL
jgi:ribosome-binding protein aMBF1 (putative translation factor)